jgi:hypothetical protein
VAKKAALKDPLPPLEVRLLVQRKCKLCEWEGEQIEYPGADPDCPWCHAPTEIVDALTLPTGLTLPGVTQGKNPYAAALGRLGGQKGGKARARALSPTRRSEIAQQAARARWRAAKAKRKKR